MKKRKLPGASDASVDMTPMLDIVFIMLIFFIVSSTFVRETGLDVTQHRNNEQEEQPAKNRAIVVRLCNNNDVFIDRRGIDIRSVRANVEKKLAEDASAVVVVEVEQQAATGSLVKVMDQAIAANAPVSIAPYAASCERVSV